MKPRASPDRFAPPPLKRSAGAERDNERDQYGSVDFSMGTDPPRKGPATRLLRDRCLGQLSRVPYVLPVLSHRTAWPNTIRGPSHRKNLISIYPYHARDSRDGYCAIDCHRVSARGKIAVDSASADNPLGNAAMALCLGDWSGGVRHALPDVPGAAALMLSIYHRLVTVGQSLSMSLSRSRSPSKIFALLAALLMGLISASAFACPMCNDAISSATTAGAPGAANSASGFFYSIITMVATPLVLMGGVTLMLIRESRAALRENV